METNKIYQGNAIDVLKTFPDESISCVMTSPPYWSLRDYQIKDDVIWDEDRNCEHEWGEKIDSPGERKGEKDPKEYGSKEVTEEEEILVNPIFV